MTQQETEDFFRKYLALHGIDGGKSDFHQIREWDAGRRGAYPPCLQKIWPLPVGKLYGYVPCDESGYSPARDIAFQLTDTTTFMRAIEAYRKQMVK